MSTSGSSVTRRLRGGRPLSIASGVAVAGVVLYTVVGFITALSGQRTASTDEVGVMTGVVFAFITAAYLLVVLRAPSTPRWVYFVFLTFLLAMAFSTALGASSATTASERAATSQPNIGGLVAVSAFIVLPLLYMRLRPPAIKVRN